MKRCSLNRRSSCTHSTHSASTALLRSSLLMLQNRKCSRALDLIHAETNLTSTALKTKARVLLLPQKSHSAATIQMKFLTSQNFRSSTADFHTASDAKLVLLVSSARDSTAFTSSTKSRCSYTAYRNRATSCTKNSASLRKRFSADWDCHSTL